MTDTCGTFEDADPSFYIFVAITAVALAIVLLLFPFNHLFYYKKE